MTNPKFGIPYFPTGNPPVKFSTTLNTLVDRKSFFDNIIYDSNGIPLPPPQLPPYDINNPAPPSISTARNKTYFAPGQSPNMIGSINPYIITFGANTGELIPIESPNNSPIFYNTNQFSISEFTIQLNAIKPEITDLYQTPIDWSKPNTILTRPQIIWLEIRIASCYFSVDPLYFFYVSSLGENIIQSQPHLGRIEAIRLASIFKEVKQYIEALRPGRTWVSVFNWVYEFEDFQDDGGPFSPPTTQWLTSMDWLGQSLNNFFPGDQSKGNAWGAGFIQTPANQATFFGTNFLHIYIGDAIIQGIYLNDAIYNGPFTTTTIMNPIIYATSPSTIARDIGFLNQYNLDADPNATLLSPASYQPAQQYNDSLSSTTIVIATLPTSYPTMNPISNVIYQSTVSFTTVTIFGPTASDIGPYTPINNIPDALGLWSIIYDQRLKPNINKFAGYSVKLFNPPDEWTIPEIPEDAISYSFSGIVPNVADFTIWQGTSLIFDAVESIATNDGIDIIHIGQSSIISNAQYLINLIANHYSFDPDTGKDL